MCGGTAGALYVRKRAALGINNGVIKILWKSQPKGISAAKGLLAPSSRNLSLYGGHIIHFHEGVLVKSRVADP